MNDANYIYHVTAVVVVRVVNEKVKVQVQVYSLASCQRHPSRLFHWAISFNILLNSPWIIQAWLLKGIHGCSSHIFFIALNGTDMTTNIVGILVAPMELEPMTPGTRTPRSLIYTYSTAVAAMQHQWHLIIISNSIHLN